MPDVELKIRTQYTPNQYPINLEHHIQSFIIGVTIVNKLQHHFAEFHNVERKCITQWNRIKSIRHQTQPNSYHYLFWCYLY